MEQRIIKFRCWVKPDSGGNDGLMFCEKDKTDYTMISNGDGFSVIFDLEHYEAKSQYVIMQFTGLTDKNGKEIYEDDILKTPCTQIRYTKKPNVHGLGAETKNVKTDGIVVCKWIGYGFVFKHEVKSKHGINLPEIEIIGNIHQDKHLLK